MKIKQAIKHMLLIGMLPFSTGLNAANVSVIDDVNTNDVHTELQSNDLAQIIQESGHGVPYTLNLSQEHHYRHVVSQLEKSGHTPENSPQMYKTIEDLKAEHAKNPPEQMAFSMQSKSEDSPEPVNSIIKLGRDASTGYNYTGTLLSSLPDGTVSTSLGLQLFNNTTKEPIGDLASSTQYGDGTDARVDAKGLWHGTPKSTDKVLAAGTVSLQPHGGGSPTFLNVHQTALAIHIPESPPVVTAPVQKIGRTVEYILSCLQRSAGNNADCDYGPYPGTGSEVQFPMKGSVAYMSEVPETLTTSNATVDFFIWDDATGGGCTLGETSSHLLSNFSTKGNTVSWNFSNANFGQACFDRLSRVDMSFTVAVQTADSGTDKVPAYVTTQGGGGTPFDTTQIKYLEFAWGCLLPNTDVLMADGKSKKIEHIKVGERVVSNYDKKPRKVVSTIKGYEEDDIYIITDKKGNRVQMTSGHTVLTGNGNVLLASQLKVDDEIQSIDGKTKIAKIEKNKYRGDVWNLVLEKAGKDSNKSTNFYANGVMVGDNSMQAFWGEYYETDHRAILDKIPEAWHVDYQNWKSRQTNKPK